MKIGVVSLGCDKNRVDTENMLAIMQENGYEITPSPEQADIIVVNTCGFIDSAKKEAIDTIFEMADYKQDSCKYLIVSGCLSQRYMDDLQQEMPEVDAFIGTDSYYMLPDIVKRLESGEKNIMVKNDKNDRHFSKKRVLTTPYHYAYLKIAEGCDNKCTYCAIPNIRGKFTSKPIADLVEEASKLIKDYGINELILVAQDVSNYGKDLYGKISLIPLLEELSKLDIKWIRLLYLYPENIDDALLDYIDKNPKICKYLDIPCQHISDKILKMMNRRVRKADIIRLFDKIKSYNKFVIRSTFIVGFPQESQQDFDQLKEFIANAQIDRCGFFAYSCEDNTPASRITGQIDEQVKLDRQEEMYAIQNEVMAKKLTNRVGKVMEVIYEGIDFDRQMFVGRTAFDAPEIDTNVYFVANKPLDIGNIYKVKITAIDGIDSLGEVYED